MLERVETGNAAAGGAASSTGAAAPVVGPIARRPLHEEAVDRLRSAIVQGELAPGIRLNERVLSERLGISRTPLREAVKLLATEGLVELLPNRGAIVAPVDAERLAQTLAVMGALEALIGELACAQASESDIAAIRALHYEMMAAHARRDLAAYFAHNQAIHLALVEAGGNAVLAHTYRQLNANVRRVRYMANLSPARWDAAVREHEEILAALTARDGVRLKALLSDHLAHKTAAVLAALQDGAAREAA
ncbi:MAG: GntR family transcriptional regulator [Betaproteobacteria bacterium]|nr:GntR family transcriptional regulator [Betaproteobacteria bacterium]